MPSRIIRGDDLLESDRYMSLPAAAQVFYIHLMCCADDFGLMPLSSISIGRRCFKARPGAAKIKSLVDLLTVADLIRPYEVDEQRFAFIPRFRQRLKNFRCRHPMPPPELFADDDEARLIFTKYNDLFKKQAPSGGGKAPTGGESRPEVKGSDLEVISKGSGSDLDSEVRPLDASAVGTSAEVKPVLIDKKQNVKNPKGNGSIEQWAKDHGYGQGVNEGKTEYRQRITEQWVKSTAVKKP